MKRKNLSMEVKRALSSSIFLITLIYGFETWMWNRAQQSRVHAMEMSYLRGAHGVTRWDGESNESMYKRYGMGVVEWAKRNALKWLENFERIES